ncbi:MAG: hypothetical protein R3247_05775, partial [Rhodothermales bacterium]|nr:hypothetical protein [Rhodothermales bacterium]
ERLKLEAVWYGADGAVLAESSKLIVSSAGPALRAGQTWPVRFIQTLPETPAFARYALRITEAE